MAKRAKIVCRGFLPDGAGGYRRVEDLTPAERAELGRALADCIGRAINDHFSQHPDEYRRL